MFAPYLSRVMEKHRLGSTEMEEAMELLMEGTVPPVQVAAFLAALRARGETPAEIGGAARVLLRKARTVQVRPGLLADNCGTGGDCAGSFNISTAAAFVAAGEGIPMAKHGNRSVSSRCGSADVAEALGAALPSSPERAAACLDAAGLVLLFAPHFHPVMGNVAEIRKSLGVRTLFNILGPLVNPAPLTHQVMGVFDAALLHPVADVLRSLGRQGMVISGHGGFDELSLAGPNRVVFFSAEGIREESVSPADGGLPLRGNEDLAGGSAPENAALIEDVLAGKRGAPRDAVVFNAAAVFLAAGRAKSWKEGTALAAESIDSGSAASVLEKVRAFAEPVRRSA
jgi:anthranilate phosphoribosyltransferase